MTPIAAVRDRLTQVTGLPHLLDAAYAAFEVMLSVVEDHEDPASGTFTQLMRAANLAADGRDAVLFAPSLPPRPLQSGRAPSGPEGVAGALWAEDLVALGEVLAGVLRYAASMAAGDGDRAACTEAAQCAAGIRWLVAGAEP